MELVYVKLHRLPYDPYKVKVMVPDEGEIRLEPKDINSSNNIQPENKTQPPVDKIEPFLSSEQEDNVCNNNYLHLYSK